jgi:glycosyltransferase involved in cell wall biosynthesis
MKGKDLISIIMPVYNSEKTLHATVNSMLTQTHTEFELIAVDDGSTDNSRSMLDEFARNDSRVRVFSKSNGGVSSALNLALSKCEGEFIARMDADDLSYRTRLEEQLDLLKTSDDIALCSSAVDYSFFRGRVFPAGRIERSASEIRVYNIFSSVHVTPTVVFDTRKIDRADLFSDETYILAEDYELFSRIGSKHKTAILPDPKLLVRRQEHGNITSKLSKRIGHFHFKVTEREVSKAGIVEPQPGLLDVFSGEDRIDAAGAEILSRWLRPIAGYDGFEGVEAVAYQRALVDLNNVVIETLYDRMPVSLLKDLMRECGMDRYISKFNRLRLRLGHAVGGEAVMLATLLRQARRYVNSKPRSYLKDRLSGKALEGI